MTQICKAVYPVAGLGNRFITATRAMPEELLPIIYKPIIQYSVVDAISAEINTLIFVTGKNKRATKGSPGINDEILLADAINILAKRGKVFVSEFKGKHFDGANKFGFIEATLHFAMQNIDFKNRIKILIESLIK